MKKLKLTTRLSLFPTFSPVLLPALCLSWGSLLLPISTHASVTGADCPTVAFDSSQFEELWGCPDTPTENAVMIAIQGEKMGLINGKGKIILPIIYDSVQPDSYEKLIDNADPKTIKFTYENNKIAGVINGLGEVVIAEYPSDNTVLGQLMLSKTKDGKSKLTNLKTHQNAVYDQVFPLTLGNDKARVMNAGKWGMVNTDTLKVEIPLIYQTLNFFQEGMVVAQLDNNFGAVDEQNNTIIPFKYQALTDFSTLPNYPLPLTVATPHNQAYFFILDRNNKTIKTIPRPDLDMIVTGFTEDLMVYRNAQGQTGIVSLQGKILYEAEEGYEVIALSNEYIDLVALASPPEASEAFFVESKLLTYTYDKQRDQLSVFEMP